MSKAPVRVVVTGAAGQIGCCSSVRYSENTAKMRAASEMSRVSIEISAAPAKACTIGSNEYVASAGA